MRRGIDTDGVPLAAFGPTLTVPYDAALRADLRAILDLAPRCRRMIRGWRLRWRG